MDLTYVNKTDNPDPVDPFFSEHNKGRKHWFPLLLTPEDLSGDRLHDD